MFAVIPSTARSQDVIIFFIAECLHFSLSTIPHYWISLWVLLWTKSEDKVTENQTITRPAQPNPLYEDIIIQEQESELKENTAYSAISQFSTIS